MSDDRWTAKRTIAGSFVKLLDHSSTSRGMTRAPWESRCLLRGEIHEIVTTDQDLLTAGDPVDRVGFLGFAEISEGGVVEVGDPVRVQGVAIGHVTGFDECHFPNHYNVLIHVSELLTASALGLAVGAEIAFA
jgi:hypothetical protein